jgi:hypothetical protein
MTAPLLSDLPPLWSDPPPLGHNGGPGLSPTDLTAELRAAITDRMIEGMPLAMIRRMDGMPDLATVQRWQRQDADFARGCIRAREMGNRILAEAVFEEVERLIQTRGADYARQVFELRKVQLAMLDPGYFG